MSLSLEGSRFVYGLCEYWFQRCILSKIMWLSALAAAIELVSLMNETQTGYRENTLYSMPRILSRYM